jgi:hypothetical protein
MTAQHFARPVSRVQLFSTGVSQWRLMHGAAPFNCQQCRAVHSANLCAVGWVLRTPTHIW